VVTPTPSVVTPTPSVVTPTPDLEPPVLSGVTLDPSYIYYGDRTCGPMSSTVSVTATDDLSGVASVTLRYEPPGQAARTASMRASGNTWTATVTSEASWQPGRIYYRFDAQDRAGNSTSLEPQGERYIFYVEQCTNQPPVVTVAQPPQDVANLGFTACTSSGPCYADVHLAASVTDDQPVSASSIIWTTDRTDFQAAQLGAGASITARLWSNRRCVWETHTITVTVTDPGGKIATAQRRIAIGTIC